MTKNLIKTLKAELKEATTKADALMRAAEAEDRVMSDEERADVDQHLAAAREAKDRLERAQGDQSMRQALAEMGLRSQPTETAAPEPRGETARRPQSLGQQFVDSEAYAFIEAGHARGRGWRTPTVELEPHAATLTEDPTSGGALLTPDYRPGIQPLLFRRLVIGDLFAQGTTDSTSVSYMRETTFTNAAAAVAEGGDKPETTLIFDRVDEQLRKIAHWLPVTDEMLEDISQIRSYIDARLTLGLDLTEEDQLLNGSGVAPNLLGLRNRPGLAPDLAKALEDSNADALFRQMMAILESSLVMPDSIVVNPANWTTIVLSKNTQGQYYGPGPFSMPPNPVLWGVRVSPTPVMPAGTGLTGAFATQGQVFRKGGITVEASNSHADFFTKDLTAIRAEKRLLLAVYRPGAFGEVTGLT